MARVVAVIAVRERATAEANQQTSIVTKVNKKDNGCSSC